MGGEELRGQQQALPLAASLEMEAATPPDDDDVSSINTAGAGGGSGGGGSGDLLADWTSFGGYGWNPCLSLLDHEGINFGRAVDDAALFQ